MPEQYNDSHVDYQSRSEQVCDAIAQRILHNANIETFEFRIRELSTQNIKDASMPMDVLSQISDESKRTKLIKLRQTLLEFVYPLLDAHTRAGNLRTDVPITEKTTYLSTLASGVLDRIHNQLS
jgi:hypothetical protein